MNTGQEWNTDQEWAQELFERSRQGEEPMWVADHAAMMRTGQRRNRVRALTASGSVVATAAVVAAVGIGVSGSVGGKAPAPGPAPGHNAAPPTLPPAAVDPSKVLDYARFVSYSPKSSGKDPGAAPKYLAVPASTARDTMQLLSKLDPPLTHIAKSEPSGTFVRLVADDDPQAENEAMVEANVTWTENGSSADALTSPTSTAPAGTLSLSFMDSSDGGVEGMEGATGCTASGLLDILHPVQTSQGGWTETAQWTPCTKSTLSDGSVLETATKDYGPFSIVSMVREFPGGRGAMAVTWENFVPPAPAGGLIQSAPDPKRVLPQNPISKAKLLAALSDPSLVPPLAATKATPPVSATPPPTTMLQPSDFGAGWTAAGRVQGTTGDLVVDNGCTNQQNPVASPQTIYGYTGTTPSGIKVTATAQLDVMKSGSGPGWMTDLRQHGSGGCDTAGMPYSRDTMAPLPAGTGDDAFVENWYGQGNETFFIRFKDDILRVDVSTADQKMPAFTQADKDWFTGLAAKAAARHGGKG